MMLPKILVLVRTSHDAGRGAAEAILEVKAWRWEPWRRRRRATGVSCRERVSKRWERDGKERVEREGFGREERQVHLYGTSLGGFLAQLFAQHRPRRVKSLVLSNSFLDTQKFSSAMPWSPIVNWTPSFLLKRYILSGIHDGPHEPFIADSVDFVVGQIETLSREDLSSRLTLNATPASVGSLLLSDSFITLMDTNDYCIVPQNLKDQVSERYPGARRAILKSGGDFPFLSRPDEVNLYLQLHLRRVGVEAKPELAQNLLHDGDAGSSSNGKKSSKDLDDPSADNGGAGMHEEGARQQSLGSESHSTDEQLLQSAAVFVVDGFLHQASFILILLQFYASSMSTTWKPLLKV